MRLSFVALAIFALAVVACARGSDEQRIRDAIATMKAAVETRQPRDFMRYIDIDFAGTEAGFDREALHNLLRAQALRNEKTGVTLGLIDVELQAGRATAKLTATLTGDRGGWLPDHGAVYSISTGWKQIGSTWLCIRADWERML